MRTFGVVTTGVPEAVRERVLREAADLGEQCLKYLRDAVNDESEFTRNVAGNLAVRAAHAAARAVHSLQCWEEESGFALVNRADVVVGNPLVEQFRKGGVPRDLRLMAAQGGLPLNPQDLLGLMAELAGDSDHLIRETAANSLAAFPADGLYPILKSSQASPSVLAWVVIYRREQELRAAALQNPSLSNEVVRAIAPALPQELAELVVINQVRQLTGTLLLDAIESNPYLSNDQRRRLRETRETFGLGDRPVICGGFATRVGWWADGTPMDAAEQAAAAQEPVSNDPPEQPIATDAAALVRYLSEQERQDAVRVGTVLKVYRLNTTEKVVTALKGTREERAALVRDPSRLVSAAVLSSPGVTADEVESFAAMKNVSDEVLRKVVRNREWMKRYGVIFNLAHNPRTPLDVSTALLGLLDPRDLANLCFDRSVPDALRRQAQKFVKRLKESKRTEKRLREALHQAEQSKKAEDGLRHQLEGLVANTMRSIQALKGKLTANEQQRVLGAIERARKTLNGGSIEELETAVAEVEQVRRLWER